MVQLFFNVGSTTTYRTIFLKVGVCENLRPPFLLQKINLKNKKFMKRFYEIIYDKIFLNGESFLFAWDPLYGTCLHARCVYDVYVMRDLVACKPPLHIQIHQPKTKFNTKSHWTRMPQILSNNLHGKWNAKNIVCHQAFLRLSQLHMTTKSAPCRKSRVNDQRVPLCKTLREMPVAKICVTIFILVQCDRHPS